MRISDWSSDVCSSDLLDDALLRGIDPVMDCLPMSGAAAGDKLADPIHRIDFRSQRCRQIAERRGKVERPDDRADRGAFADDGKGRDRRNAAVAGRSDAAQETSGEGRVGKGWGRTCRSEWCA